MSRSMLIARLFAAGACLGAASAASGAPDVTRLTPPSRLFSTGQVGGPITSRFLPGQRFDLQATIIPDTPGVLILSAEFRVDGVLVPGTVTLTPPTVAGFPTGSMIASLRAYANFTPGVHTLTVNALQMDNQTVSESGNFEIMGITQQGRRAKNVIFFIGDGMGIAHRTAARLVKHGATQGKPDGLLAMDQMPVAGLVMSHSLNSIVTDSSPGAACYATGNKSNNNQQGVFPDDTTANFDNPRVELIGEYLSRTQGKSLGIVATSDVFDATPGSFGTHTSNRGAGTGICDQFLDEAVFEGNLRVLLGGGRKWFLPNTTPGSARNNSSDYVLPTDIVNAWGVSPGVLDPARDLIADFQTAGFIYAANKTQLTSISPTTDRLLGLFSLSNMNVALDKIEGRRGNPAVVNDYGFPDQPMLNEMTQAALNVLGRNPNGFVLMVEAASIDKQAHNMDTERWILDTIEFDDAIAVGRAYQAANPDTLVIVTADHECAGINIIGSSRVTDAELQARIATGQGETQVRNGVVGTYESAGFPRYTTAPDGYPVTANVDYRMLIGYAANGDRFEDWRTNPQPLRDSQQPFNNSPPLNTYPSGPLNRDTVGNFRVTGQVADSSAAHTASDFPLTAQGRGSALLGGVMDNTDVFFRAMQAILGGSR